MGATLVARRSATRRSTRSVEPQIDWRRRAKITLHEQLGKRRTWTESLGRYRVDHFAITGRFVATCCGCLIGVSQASLRAAMRLCEQHLAGESRQRGEA